MNDLWLKWAYAGVLTGKLSDLAGLFLVARLGARLFPNRRLVALTVIAVSFTLWKLPAADALVRTWNSLAIWPVSRALDLTDLFALVAVPFALVSRNQLAPIPRRSNHLPAYVVVVAALLATSKPPRVFEFEAPQPSFLLDGPVDQVRAWVESRGGYFPVPGTECYGGAMAIVSLADSSRSLVVVRSVSIDGTCDRTIRRDSLLGLFKQALLAQ